MSDAATVVPARPGPPRPAFTGRAIRDAFASNKILALAIALVAIGAFFAWQTGGDYLEPRNISNLLRQMAITGLLAAGMCFVIISGEIDLSVGSLLGLMGAAAALLDVDLHLPVPLTVLLVLAGGTLVGMFNGFATAYLRIPSFIVGLAGLLAFRGVVIGITGGQTIAPVSAPLVAIGQAYLPRPVGDAIAAAVFLGFVWSTWRNRIRRREADLPVPSAMRDALKVAAVGGALLAFVAVLDNYHGVPVPVLVLLVVAGLFNFVARRTVFGRRIYAIGGNLEATRLSGVDVRAVKLAIFAIMGTMSALAGIVTTARLAAGSPSAGSLGELDAISSCIIGGTSMRGGAGNVLGALFGALIMSSLDNGMSMMGLDTYWQMIVKGVILLLAVWIDIATSTRA
jgi:D-xylose transport system permease protein